VSLPPTPAPSPAVVADPDAIREGLQALSVALDELATAQVRAPEHARVPGAEVLLGRCRDLVSTLAGGTSGDGTDGTTSPEQQLARLNAGRDVGAGWGPRATTGAPEWHDWFMAPAVRSTRRRR
jgi:hypothetical protein